MVNRGEEKVRVHMNVVPRSTGNTNSGTRELTLKCKLIIVLLKPMNNPLGVSPSKGKQGTTHDLRISDGRSNPEVVGSIPTEVKRFFLCLVWFPVSLY